MDNKAEFLKLCSHCAQEVMRPMTEQMEYVYLDAELLFDFKLGAMLAWTKNEADYNYILEHKDEYLATPTLECAKFFPKFGKTEEDIYALWNNPNNSRAMSVIVPGTQVLQSLEQLIRGISTENESRETRRPLNITINQSEVPFGELLKAKILRIVHNADQRIKVEFTNYGWDTIPEETLKRMDVIGVYDMRKFVKTGTVSQKLLASAVEFSKAHILALEQTSVQDKDEKKVRKSIDNFTDTMNLLCGKFTFIEKSLVKETDNG